MEWCAPHSKKIIHTSNISGTRKSREIDNVAMNLKTTAYVAVCTTFISAAITKGAIMTEKNNGGRREMSSTDVRMIASVITTQLRVIANPGGHPRGQWKEGFPTIECCCRSFLPFFRGKRMTNWLLNNVCVLHEIITAKQLLIPFRFACKINERNIYRKKDLLVACTLKFWTRLSRRRWLENLLCQFKMSWRPTRHPRWWWCPTAWPPEDRPGKEGSRHQEPSNPLPASRG